MAAAKVRASIWMQVSAELRCCHRSNCHKRDSPRPRLSEPAALPQHREVCSGAPLLLQEGGGLKKAFRNTSSVKGGEGWAGNCLLWLSRANLPISLSGRSVTTDRLPLLA